MDFISACSFCACRKFFLTQQYSRCSREGGWATHCVCIPSRIEIDQEALATRWRILFMCFALYLSCVSTWLISSRMLLFLTTVPDLVMSTSIWQQMSRQHGVDYVSTCFTFCWMRLYLLPNVNFFLPWCEFWFHRYVISQQPVGSSRACKHVVSFLVHLKKTSQIICM